MGPKRNLDHRSFFILSRYVKGSIQIIFFSNEAHLTVTVFVTALCFSHHACCLLYTWAKLTVAFTITSFPFNLYTCVIACGCGFGLEQNFWLIDGFGEKKKRIGGFAYPYSPPSLSCFVMKTQIRQNDEYISFGYCSDGIFRLVSVSVHNIVHVVSNNTPGVAVA